MPIEERRQSLAGKHIVLGVTGSIAAYKSADLIRRLQDSGAEVRVVMTRSACEFITPMTLQTLSGHPVAIDLLDADQESAMGHIKLARWADWIVIAPATADTLSRLVQGRADDLLTTTCLASESPIALAPAMNNKMWSQAITQENLEKLIARGCYILGPESGEQACGETGLGRMLEPADLVSELIQLSLPAQLKGKKVLITAGPTYEAIDPVRFIGNRSSGKMGFALAKAAAEAGAQVYLISGPVNLVTPTNVERKDVETAEQMYDAVMEKSEYFDIFISTAAVADYKPENIAQQKIKKQTDEKIQLVLQRTQDIVAAVAAKKIRPFVVGFAAETEQLEQHAKDKLQRKGLDMIAANKVGENLGFSRDENALHVFWKQGSQQFPLANKIVLARNLMTLIIKQFYAKNTVKTS